MTKRDEILKALSTDMALDKTIRKLCGNDPFLMEEGKQELFVLLCKMSEDELLGLHENKQLNFWIVAILKNFFHSDRSTFYNQIRKFTRNNIAKGDYSVFGFFEDTMGYRHVHPTTDSAYHESKFESFQRHIENLPEFDKRMIQQFLLCKTLAELAKKLRLNYDLVRRIMKRIMNDLKVKITEDIKDIEEEKRVLVSPKKTLFFFENEEEDTVAYNQSYVGYSDDVEQFEIKNYNGPIKHER